MAKAGPVPGNLDVHEPAIQPNGTGRTPARRIGIGVPGSWTVLVPVTTVAIDHPGIGKTARPTGAGEMTAFATNAMSARFPRATRSSTDETASPKHLKASAKSSRS